MPSEPFLLTFPYQKKEELLSVSYKLTDRHIHFKSGNAILPL